MEFASNELAQKFFKKLGTDTEGLILGSRAATRYRSRAWRYESPLSGVEYVAKIIYGLHPKFQEFVVWTYGLPWGDRSMEDTPPLDWQRYSEWRKSLGGFANLYEHPCHVFNEREHELACRTIEFAILLGWDTLIGSNTSSPLIELSHNDRITIHARGNLSTVSDEFKKLGLIAV